MERANFLLDVVGSFAVGFVDYENVGDFHNSGLEALDVVAHARDEDDEGQVGEAGDFDFVLADAYRLDEDDVFAAGFEYERCVGGREREAAESAACGHAACVEAWVAGMLAQADAVAEQSAAGEGAGGIDGEKANGPVGMAEVLSEAVDKGALAGSGGARDADAERAAGVREAG